MLSGHIVVAQATHDSAWLTDAGRSCSMKSALASCCALLSCRHQKQALREDLMRTGLKTIAAGLVIGAAVSYANVASAEDGWVTLLDASKKGDWTEVGKANWAMKDGALSADKLDGKDPSYMVSKEAYKDFQIRAEFWTDEEANSGIFIRCEQRDKIDSKVCYEVNIFDKRPDPSYGTGAIVGVAKVDPMPKAAGKWNV